MEREKPTQREGFPLGSKVRIKERRELEAFRRTWKFHHPLSAEQVAFAGKRDTVVGVAFSQDGDALYELKDAPGKWHAVLLAAA